MLIPTGRIVATVDLETLGGKTNCKFKAHKTPLLYFIRRLDYFVLSQQILPQLCDCVMKKHITGSDHCPIVLLLATRMIVVENET